MTTEEKVLKYAEEVSWDEGKIKDFINTGIFKEEYDTLEGDGSSGKAKEFIKKYQVLNLELKLAQAEAEVTEIKKEIKLVKEKPLHISEDGVPLFEGDITVVVNIKDNRIANRNYTFIKDTVEYHLERFKYFKSFDKALEFINKPRIGNVCKFWDDNPEEFCIGILEDVTYREYNTKFNSFDNCEKITDEQIIKYFK